MRRQDRGEPVRWPTRSIIAIVTISASAVAAGASPGVASDPAVSDPGDLYALDLASGRISRLTTNPGLDGAPAWMPDGQRLLFGRLDAGTDLRIAAVTLTEHHHFAICIVDVTTGSVTVLTDDAADDYYPAWSPDGDTIVFTRAASP